MIGMNDQRTDRIPQTPGQHFFIQIWMNVSQGKTNDQWNGEADLTAEVHSRIHSPNEGSYVYTQTLDLRRKWAAPDTTEE